VRRWREDGRCRIDPSRREQIEPATPKIVPLVRSIALALAAVFSLMLVERKPNPFGVRRFVIYDLPQPLIFSHGRYLPLLVERTHGL
jgi:hypothetical protein